MAGIQDWDRVGLPIAAHQESVSAADLVAAIGIEQFTARMAQSWINDARGRGLLRRTTEGRFAITDKGRARVD